MLHTESLHSGPECSWEGKAAKEENRAKRQTTCILHSPLSQSHMHMSLHHRGITYVFLSAHGSLGLNLSERKVRRMK